MLICYKSSTAAIDRGTKRRVAPLDDLSLDHQRKRNCKSASLSRPGSPAEIATEAAADAEPPDLRHNPVGFWATQGTWPPPSLAGPSVERILARRNSISSFDQDVFDFGHSPVCSDLSLPEDNAALYRDPLYDMFQNQGDMSMEMDVPENPLPEIPPAEIGITDESESLVHDLVNHEQVFPAGTIFDDGLFAAACLNVKDKNPERITQDISRLIVPSAETLALRDEKFQNLVESVNEFWSHSIPLTSLRPKPGYSVGFRRAAFSQQRLVKLSPFLGNIVGGDQSFFMGTSYMYFPFLMCEVGTGSTALDNADDQSAHSTSIAVRAVAELFLAVGRESEVNRKIVAFSVSHDHCSVRIYGHYPVIQNRNIQYFRHPIQEFDFTPTEDGDQRWTAYQFVKNVYERWAPAHLDAICSAVDQLPDEVNVGIVALRSTGLSRTFSAQHFSSFTSEAVLAEVCASQPSVPQEPLTTPGTIYTGF
ncbi:unnamed protein product [Clonostachys rosea]|uniref:DUF7924 domain-containing protein n=1 Tax=Bionectria ochroleuca TaxID=29856 RepID=A0ABY6V3G3_BIOOC|nr:unnamed protein product [Clonostachys rosea]